MIALRVIAHALIIFDAEVILPLAEGKYSSNVQF